MHSDSRPPFFDRSWKPGRGLFYNGFRTGNPGGRIKTTPLPGRCRRVVTRWRAFRPQKRRFRGVFNVRKTTRWNRSIGRDSHNSVCPLKSLSPSPTAVRRPPKRVWWIVDFPPGRRRQERDRWEIVLLAEPKTSGLPDTWKRFVSLSV